MTLDNGFIIAASAEIFWRDTVLPADKSTIAIWDWPVSQTVINLSDSMEHDPSLTFSRGIDKGALESCKKKMAPLGFVEKKSGRTKPTYI